MAKFLTTSGTNYHLEEMIKDAKDKLILISPFLRINDRIKELLEDKNRLKIDVRIVYGKNELQPEEINWLKELMYIRTSFCKNLHAKCYINEELCIITSLNLYEFSQINNNEMGILLSRRDDAEVYNDACEEASRIIRVSDEIRISLEKVAKDEDVAESEPLGEGGVVGAKITSSKVARKYGLKTDEFLQKMARSGFLRPDGADYKLTDKGTAAGGESRVSPRFGSYFLWPETLDVDLS